MPALEHRCAFVEVSPPTARSRTPRDEALPTARVPFCVLSPGLHFVRFVQCSVRPLRQIGDMNTSKLAGLVYYSPNPVALADFYREALGVTLSASAHGHVGNHIEGLLGDVHVAIWDQKQGHGVSPLVPSFRCGALEQVSDNAVRMGAKPLHRPIEIGEGKRVVTLLDPDARAFRLISFAAP